MANLDLQMNASHTWLPAPIPYWNTLQAFSTWKEITVAHHFLNLNYLWLFYKKSKIIDFKVNNQIL